MNRCCHQTQPLVVAHGRVVLAVRQLPGLPACTCGSERPLGRSRFVLCAARLELPSAFLRGLPVPDQQLALAPGWRVQLRRLARRLVLGLVQLPQRVHHLHAHCECWPTPGPSSLQRLRSLALLASWIHGVHFCRGGIYGQHHPKQILLTQGPAVQGGIYAGVSGRPLQLPSRP